MTNIPRLFVRSLLSSAESIALDEGQSKYLTRVMRLGDGGVIRAFDGESGEWSCRIEISGKRVSLMPIDRIREQTVLQALKLYFAPLKKTRTDFVIEKAAELGVTEIQPTITEFTQASRVRTDRLTALATEAAEQTERLDVPRIVDAVSLSAALASHNVEIPLYYCDEGSEARPMQDVLNASGQSEGAILIGPEGGFADRERKMLHALAFVKPVTLGPRILRAETAVVSALTLWQSQVGDWRSAPYVPKII